MDGESFLIELENLFTALADKTRLRLLNLMREEEICVCFFTEVLGESQPKISRHLAYLRNSGLVSARREGKWMHYKIEMPENENLAKIFSSTLEALETQDDMRIDYENLINVCCSPQAPVTIARAPKPDALLETHISAAETNNHSVREDQLETFLL